MPFFVEVSGSKFKATLLENFVHPSCNPLRYFVFEKNNHKGCPKGHAKWHKVIHFLTEISELLRLRLQFVGLFFHIQSICFKIVLIVN